MSGEQVFFKKLKVYEKENCPVSIYLFPSLCSKLKQQTLHRSRLSELSHKYITSPVAS